MKPPTFVAVATALVVAVFAWEIFGAPVDYCPKCDDLKNKTEPIICAQEETHYQGTFENFCSMLRFNCLHNRRYYMIANGTRCDPDKAVKKINTKETASKSSATTQQTTAKKAT